MKISSLVARKVYIVLGVLLGIVVTSALSISKEVFPLSAPGIPQASSTVEATPSATPKPQHVGEFATVVSVVDGDTIKVEGGEIVRYIGVDTPETVECFSKEATSKNHEFVLGKAVELEKDVSERDRYGRLLRYIWIGDTLINEVLVRDGFARVSTYPPDVKYVDRFLAAERLAREEKKGLWSGECPLPTP